MEQFDHVTELGVTEAVQGREAAAAETEVFDPPLRELGNGETRPADGNITRTLS
jgi:hypothetical protein